MSRSRSVSVHLLLVLVLAVGLLVAEWAGVVPAVDQPTASAADVCGLVQCPDESEEANGDVIVVGMTFDTLRNEWLPTNGGVPYGGFYGQELALGAYFLDGHGQVAGPADVFRAVTITSGACPNRQRFLALEDNGYYFFKLPLEPVAGHTSCQLTIAAEVDDKLVSKTWTIQALAKPQQLSWFNGRAELLPPDGLSALVTDQTTIVGVKSNAWGASINLTATGQCTAVLRGSHISFLTMTYFAVTGTGPGTCRLHAEATAGTFEWASESLDAELHVYPKQNIIDWGGWVQWMPDAAPPVSLTYPTAEPTMVGGTSQGGQVLLNASGACFAGYDPSFMNGEFASRWLVTPTGTGNCTLTLTALVFRLDGGLPPALTVTIPVVTPQTPNHDPVADFAVTQLDTPAPSAVSFDASATTDADGDELTYWWDFGNGDNASGVTASTTYTRAGTFDVTLTVFDPSGATSTITEQVTVTDPTPPIITRTLTATEGNNGWYTSDVGIIFTVTDLESEVTSTNGCDGTTLVTDTAETPVTCTAASAGGMSSRTIFVKRDATPPTLAPVVSPGTVLLGSPATIDAHAADAMSGLGTVTCDEPSTTHLGPGSTACTATDVAGNSASASAPFTVIDASAPVITPTVVGTLGDNGWYTSDVGVSWSVADPDAPVTATTGCNTTALTADTSGTTFTCTATSAGGTASKTVAIKRDATAPTLAARVTPNPVVLGGTAVATPGATDNGSGVASQSCDAPNVTRPGPATVGCTAIDKAGHRASASAPYSVVYSWQGFRWPVNTPSVVNKMKAGLGAPIRFALDGDRGLDILAGPPASNPVSCPRRGSVDTVELALPAWLSSGLWYSRLTRDYTYLWTTDRSWKGTCREFVLTLRDGTTHRLLFQFT